MKKLFLALLIGLSLLTSCKKENIMSGSGIYYFDYFVN